MPDVEFTNSVHGQQVHESSLRRGDTVWILRIGINPETINIIPGHIISRNDQRNGPNDWTIMYDVACPVLRGLNVEWRIFRTDTKCMFEEKEDAIAAAEYYLREKLREEGNWFEKLVKDNKGWDVDWNSCVACKA